MDVAVVVPWHPGCAHRERSWAWVAARYRNRHPDWRLIEALYTEEPWVKARAVTPALAGLDKNMIIIVADADVWCDGLAEAVDAVRAGHQWAIPHGHVRRLNETATASVLAGGEPSEATDRELTERPYLGTQGGGLVVAHQRLLADVPLDRRFAGWGGEDHAWGYALETFAGGPWRNQTVPLFHLWHPPQQRPNRRRGSAASEDLRRRYLRAHRRPDLMRELVDAGR